MRRDFDTDQSADTEGIAVIKKVQRKIREHVRDAYPLECCGLLFGRAGKTGPLMIEDSVRTENVSEKKETHFQIAPLEMFRHERKQAERGFELLGFYHSHPDQPAVPSEEDVRKMLPEVIYLIVSVTDGEPGGIRAWMKEQGTGTVREPGTGEGTG